MYYFFYFPLGTETRLKRTPVATLGLVVLLALVHYLLNYFGPTYAWWDRLVLSADAPTLSQALTACLVHANLLHLGGNLLYLVTFGPALEDRVGRAAFLAVFFLSGLVSMLVEAELTRILHPGQSGVVVLGASGAISGLMGLFAARCWFLRVRVAHATFAYLRGTTRGGVTALPAWVALAAWSGLQAIYAAIALGDPRGDTAYWAHFAGLAMGLGIGAASGLFRRGLWERRLLRAERYLGEANWYAALGEFEAYREGAGERAEGMLGEARCLRLVRRDRDALAAYHSAFALLAERVAWGEAADVAEEMGRLDDAALPDPRVLAQVAQGLESAGELVRAADFYERTGAAERSDASAAEVLERAGDIARRDLGDLDRAARLLDAASERLQAAGSRDGADACRAERLRRLSSECRSVLAHRMRVSTAG
jgi:membrane associated rhomboid family serine protease